MGIYHLFILLFQFNSYPRKATIFKYLKTLILTRYGYEHMHLNRSLWIAASVDFLQRTFVTVVFQIFKAASYLWKVLILIIASKQHRNPIENSVISGSNSAFTFTDNGDV